MKRIFSCSLIAALLLPLPATAQAPQMQRIGAAGAVAGRVQALAPAPGAVGRILGSGQPLYLNDSVTTDSQGRLQVLLLDETVFTIGPNSSMVLDAFVYDPSTGAGKVAARILKGVFRFVTGKIARRKPSEMEVRMPVGVIGVRGTIVAGEATDKSSLVVLLGPGAGNNAGERVGQARVENNGKATFLLQPGSATAIEGPDGAPIPAFKLPQDKLDALLGSLSNPQGNEKGTQGDAGTLQDSSGSKVSGQDTGEGLGNANDAEDDTAAFNDASQLLNAINGTVIADGPATWDQVRTIETGVGTYVGTGVFTQTRDSLGSPCTSPSCSGTSTLVMDIDFGARTVGGGGSTLSWKALNSASTSISLTSFAGLGGTATLPSSSLTDPNFSGTTITLSNSGGTVAKEAVADIQYNATGAGAGAGYGSVTGTR